MEQVPPQVSELLAALAAALPVLLGRNLVGVYLCGSLTQRAFDARYSDIDLLAVTRRPLSEAQFRRVGAWLARRAAADPWMLRLQASFLRCERLFVGTAEPVACLYQHGALQRCGMDANCILWRNVLDSGMTLYGPPPASFVPPITRAMFLASLRLELAYLREEITGKTSRWRQVPYYQAYAVLTVCRILYSLARDRVVSKPAAARWALRTLPQQWHALIRLALAGRDPAGTARLPLRPIAALIRLAEREFAALADA
jgi:hypothetical protein